MGKTDIRLWWPRGDDPGGRNLGDVLNPFILNGLGYSASWIKLRTHGKFMCIGSIAQYAKPGDIIWGSGVISRRDRVTRGALKLAVRGPITGEIAGCKTFGDPALLCADLFPVSERGGCAAVVPHYVDLSIPVDSMRVISPVTDDPVQTTKEIAGCSAIYSSSLHGIIIAHSYGIPAGWWRPSNNLGGDDCKFEDYAESVGVKLKPSPRLAGVELVLPDPKIVNNLKQKLKDAIYTHKPVR